MGDLAFMLVSRLWFHSFKGIGVSVPSWQPPASRVIGHREPSHHRCSSRGCSAIVRQSVEEPQAQGKAGAAAVEDAQHEAPQRPAPRLARAKTQNYWSGTVREEADAFAEGRLPKGYFEYLYGIWPVLFALRAGRRRFKRLFVQEVVGGRQTVEPQHKEERDEIRKRCRQLGIKVMETGRFNLDKFSKGRPHQGYILKCISAAPERLETMPKPTRGAMWLALEGITDPMNLGALMRTAAYFGIKGVVSERGSVRFTPVASKASSGAGENIPFFGANNLRKLLDGARSSGWRVVGAATPHPEDEAKGIVSRSLDDPAALRTLSGDDGSSGGGVVLVLGSEGGGLRANIRQECDELVYIAGGVDGLDSLNVSVAAGILIHAARRGVGATEPSLPFLPPAPVIPSPSSPSLPSPVPSVPSVPPSPILERTVQS